MNETDKKLYKSFLEHLKRGLTMTKASLAREASISRKTIEYRMDKHTFQDLGKYRS